MARRIARSQYAFPFKQCKSIRDVYKVMTRQCEIIFPVHIKSGRLMADNSYEVRLVVSSPLRLSVAVYSRVHFMCNCFLRFAVITGFLHIHFIFILIIYVIRFFKYDIL